MRLEHDAIEPGSYGLTQRAEVDAQAVVARHLNHLTLLSGQRDAERIPRPLHNEGWDRHRIELGGACSAQAWRPTGAVATAGTRGK